MSLHFGHCEKCGNSYLIGIDGKDIRPTKPYESGKVGGVPYIALDSESLSQAPPIVDTETECQNCGAICKIKIATEAS